MTETIQIGDRVQVFLDAKKFGSEAWVEGTVFRIDPYSRHRRFYWVKLDEDFQSLVGFGEISVFNPKHIRKSA